jgi:hypothetical protein
MPSVRSQTSVNQEAIANGKGDSGITLEESLNDEPLCQSPGALPQNMDVTFRVDNGHSPFSWEQSRFDYQVETPKPHARLSPTEKARLCSIAMPSQSFTASPLSFSLSPDPEESRSRRSRTSSESSESDCLAPRSRRPINKRKAHNVVERRYRTNLADKITVLRDSIPSLRAVAENNSPDEDSPGCSNATKLNKVCPAYHTLFTLSVI